jgi:uncharacterized tellurite resistance protein B-like protein
MELRDLNSDERVALAALLEYVVMASGRVTEDEQREIDDIVEALGEDAYRQAVEEVDRRFADEDAVRAFLKTIMRQEAREVIFGAVMEAAMADAVEGRESQMLDWLASEWKIEITYEEPPAAGEKE